MNRLLQNFLEESGFRPFPVASYFDRLVDDIALQSVEPQEVAAFARKIDRPGRGCGCNQLHRPAHRGIVPMLEEQLGKPVVTSNLAILWHALAIGGIAARPSHAGRLFAITAAHGE